MSRRPTCRRRQIHGEEVGEQPCRLVAFPKFRAPPGTMLCSRNPNTLATGMRQIEFTFNPCAEQEGGAGADARRSMLRPHDYT